MTKAIVPPPAATPVPIRMPGQGMPVGTSPGAADASQWQSVASQVLGPSAFPRQARDPGPGVDTGAAADAVPTADVSVPSTVPQGAAHGPVTSVQVHGLPLVEQADAGHLESDAAPVLAALPHQGLQGEAEDAVARLAPPPVPDLADSGDPAATHDAAGDVVIPAPGSYVSSPFEMLVLSSGKGIATDPSWGVEPAQTTPPVQTAGAHFEGVNRTQALLAPSALVESQQPGTVDLGTLAPDTQISGGDLPDQMGPPGVGATANVGTITGMPEAPLPTMAADRPQPTSPAVLTAVGLSGASMSVRADGSAALSSFATVDGLDMSPAPLAGTSAPGDGPSFASVVTRSELPGTMAPQAPVDLLSPGSESAGLQSGRVADSAIDPLEALVGSALSSAPGGPSTEALAARGAIPNTATFGQAQVRQVAEMVLHAPRDGVIELTLDPVELGRVRLSLTPGDHVMNVVLAADRPETLELMRRHADALSGALREMGYANVSLDFAGAGSGGQGGNPAAPPPPAADDSAATTGTDTASPLGASQTVATLGGLDLRF